MEDEVVAFLMLMVGEYTYTFHRLDKRKQATTCTLYLLIENACFQHQGWLPFEGHFLVENDIDYDHFAGSVSPSLVWRVDLLHKVENGRIVRTVYLSGTEKTVYEAFLNSLFRLHQQMLSRENSTAKNPIQCPACSVVRHD